jgi:hypothetical protein
MRFPGLPDSSGTKFGLCWRAERKWVCVARSLPVRPARKRLQLRMSSRKELTQELTIGPKKNNLPNKVMLSPPNRSPTQGLADRMFMVGSSALPWSGLDSSGGITRENRLCHFGLQECWNLTVHSFRMAQARVDDFFQPRAASACPNAGEWNLIERKTGSGAAERF